MQLQERLHSSLKTKGELSQKYKEAAQAAKNLEEALWGMTQRVETLAELAVSVQFMTTLEKSIVPTADDTEKA